MKGVTLAELTNPLLSEQVRLFQQLRLYVEESQAAVKEFLKLTKGFDDAVNMGVRKLALHAQEEIVGKQADQFSVLSRKVEQAWIQQATWNGALGRVFSFNHVSPEIKDGLRAVSRLLEEEAPTLKACVVRLANMMYASMFVDASSDLVDIAWLAATQ